LCDQPGLLEGLLLHDLRVEQKFIGVLGSSFAFPSSHRLGRSNGSRPPTAAARSNASPNVVWNRTFSLPTSYPFTCPYASRSVNVASGATPRPNARNRTFASSAYACRSGSSTSVSYRVRSRRASASIAFASRIIESWLASIAGLPPSTSRFRSAGSNSFVPDTSSSARAAGFFPASTSFTVGCSPPSTSARKVSDAVSFARSRSG